MDAPPPPPPTAELFELAPPMDPAANNSAYDSHQFHLGTLKTRPCSLFSAGIATIASNYGGIEQQNEEEGQIHGVGVNSEQQQQPPSPPPASGAHAPFVMAPLVAATFRRPSASVVHQSPPLFPTASSALYPHVYSSAESTPSAFFPTSAVTPTYGGCFSLDPIGMAFAWNFFGTNDVQIGYELNTSNSSESPSIENPPLIPSAVYPSTPSAPPPPQVQLSALVLPPSSQSFNIESPISDLNSPQISNRQTNKTSALSMPRGTTKTVAQRRGGRRPREAEDHQLTDEDKDRRAKRRERNKQAAARCRRRREEKMQSLQEQVDELRKQNERRENEIRKMREKEQRLLEMLRLRNGGIVQQQLHHHLQAVHVQQQHQSVADHPTVSRPTSLLQPFLVGLNNKKRFCEAPAVPSSSSSAASTERKEESDMGSSTDESPNGEGEGRNFPLGGPLVNGTDPVISVSALSQPINFEPATSVSPSKRPKFEPFDASNIRPTSLQLNTLYREGFVAGTPSKELTHFGVNGAEVELTPVAELTPGLSQFTQLAGHPTFGVLMAQETGLTPCQHGPVLIQRNGDRPANGELSELR